MRDYVKFIADDALRTDLERGEICRHIETMGFRPRFLILIENDGFDDIEATWASCVNQLYPASLITEHFDEIVAASDENEYLLWLQAGDRLNIRALYEFASLLNADRSSQFIYCDEDTWSDDGRFDPFFKPNWSPDYLEAMNYVGSSGCYDMNLARDILIRATGQYDFTLRFCERTQAIAHVQSILLHRRRSADCPPDENEHAKNIAALAGRLARTGRTGHIEPSADGCGAYGVVVQLKTEPLVSIVIPTAAKIVAINGQPRDLIAACINSIAECSTYRNL